MRFSCAPHYRRHCPRRCGGGGRRGNCPRFGETVERRTLHRRLYLTRGRLEFSPEIRSPEELHAVGPKISSVLRQEDAAKWER